MIGHALLSAMEQVEEASTALHTTSWVWGGLTVDIYQGCFLREHHDLDYLTFHLHELISPMTDSFQNMGWRVRQLSNGDLRAEKEGIGIQLGNVNISREVCWTHNGDLGALSFPLEWLIQQPRKIYDVEVHVIAPELQYVLLAHPELLNPKWILREKDIAAKTTLKTILEANGIDEAGLATMIHD